MNGLLPTRLQNLFAAALMTRCSCLEVRKRIVNESRRLWTGIRTGWRRACWMRQDRGPGGWRSRLGCSGVLLVWILGPFVSRQRTEHHRNALAEQFRRRVRVSVWRDLAEESLDLLKAQFRMGHFAAAKFQGDFHLNFVAEEINSMAQLNAEVVRINARAKLDFFDLVGVLVLLGFAILLRLLVAELPVVHDAAHRRIGIRRDFHQVHAVSAGEVDGVAQGKYAQLFSIDPDDPNFRGANFPVDSHEGTAERGTRGIRAAQGTLTS